MAELFVKYAPLWAALFSWVLAQCIKLVISLVQEGRINVAKLIDTGGMPSSHSALVASICTSVGLIRGWDSIEFAITAVFTAIVLYDATGIRRSAGEHAAALNDIIPQLLAGKFLKPDTKFREEYRELLGHNPAEVVVGSILGAIVTLLFLYGYGVVR
ncbi:MAG: divergent PAP2 family protein [bacterium]|jgi:hypothetical protein